MNQGSGIRESGIMRVSSGDLCLLCPRADKGAGSTCCVYLGLSHYWMSEFWFCCAPKQIKGLVLPLIPPDPTRRRHVVLMSCTWWGEVKRSKPAGRGFLLRGKQT